MNKLPKENETLPGEVMTLGVSVTRSNDLDDGMLMVSFENEEKPFTATFEGRRDLVLMAFDGFLNFARHSSPPLIEALPPAAATEMQRMFNEAERKIFDEGMNTITLESKVARH